MSLYELIRKRFKELSHIAQFSTIENTIKVIKDPESAKTTGWIVYCYATPRNGAKHSVVIAEAEKLGLKFEMFSSANPDAMYFDMFVDAEETDNA